MQRLRSSYLLGLAALAFIPASGAMAAVSLALAGNGAAHTGTSTTVNLGLGQNTFDVGVELISTTANTADQVISLAYKLQQTSGNTKPGGYFSLVGADLVTGINPASNRFTDAITSDPTVDGNGISGGGDPLNPSSTYLLGGNINRNFNATLTGLGNNFPTANSFSPNLIGTYTLKVDPSTPAGVYTIGVLYAAAPNDYAYVINAATGTYGDGAFTAPPSNPNGLTQTFTVTVAVPEPSSALLLGLGVAAVGLGRRRRVMALA